ncbi:MAG: hypothetical protein JSW61_03980 [Candidatus Thorarchaeota archaeon]|nr:MAG: hypothetical protein JSW61_03980 [Candidatus Thorarchaeota archaeon]
MKKVSQFVIAYIISLLMLGSAATLLGAGDPSFSATMPPETRVPGIFISQIEMTSGVSVSGSLEDTNESDMYTIDVGLFAVTMHTVLIIPPDADFDVYGRLGEPPTIDDYDWRGFSTTGEDVSFSHPSPGTWYIMVHSWRGSGTYTLTVWIESSVVEFPGVLSDGVASSGSLLHEGDISIWEISIVNTTNSMRVLLNCGNNDFDLYAARDRYPTRSEYDWASTDYGGEDYTHDDPETGTWYIMVYAFSGTGAYEITVLLEPADPFNFFEGVGDFFLSPIVAWFIIPAFLAVVCVLAFRSCPSRKVDRGFVLDSGRPDPFQYGQTYEPRYCTYCGTLQKAGADICHECGAHIPDNW